MENKDFTEGTIINGIPYIPLIIKNPNNGKSTVVELIIDSGAQHTLISKEILYNNLNYKQNESAGDIVIQGIIPKKECIAYCPEFIIDIFMNRKWLRETRVVAFDITSNHGILGRNILQFFNLDLNFLNNAVNFKRE
jgi:hypothetical protein